MTSKNDRKAESKTRPGSAAEPKSARQGENGGAPSGERQMDMLHGPLFGKILMFAVPLAASSILQQLFNSADVAVVGRFAGSEALAAVGGNSSVISLLINLFVGLSVGANVVIGNFIGQGKEDKVRQAVHTAIPLALISGVILLFVGLLAARPILLLMNTPENVVGLATLYLRIYFLGMPFVMLYNFGSAILRSVGDTRRPLYCLLISGTVNVVLNLVLVIAFGLGVAGVAIATVIANVISSGLITLFLLREKGAIRLNPRDIAIDRSILLRIIAIGVPSGIQGMVFSLSNVCIQSAINGFGSDAVAGSAAAVNFEFFTYFVTSAFSQAAVTFTSQNFGARQFDRCKKIFRICLIAGVAITGAMALMFVGGRDFFVRIYTTDEGVIPYAMTRMTHVEIFAFLPVLYEVAGGALRGMGRSMLPALLTVFGSCVLRIIWVYTVFQRYDSFSMLMNVYPVTWLVTSVLVVGAYLVCRHRAQAA